MRAADCLSFCLFLSGFGYSVWFWIIVFVDSLCFRVCRLWFTAFWWFARWPLFWLVCVFVCLGSVCVLFLVWVFLGVPYCLVITVDLLNVLYCLLLMWGWFTGFVAFGFAETVVYVCLCIAWFWFVRRVPVWCFAPAEVLLFGIKVLLDVWVVCLLGLVCLGWCSGFTNFGFTWGLLVCVCFWFGLVWFCGCGLISCALSSGFTCLLQFWVGVYLVFGCWRIELIGLGLAVGCLLPGFPDWFCFVVVAFGWLVCSLFVLWVYGVACALGLFLCGLLEFVIPGWFWFGFNFVGFALLSLHVYTLLGVCVLTGFTWTFVVDLVA